MTDEKTSRVAMLWPESLKDRVRERVGKRGLTAFTIQAVEASLAAPPATQDKEEPAPPEEDVEPESEVEADPEPEPEPESEVTAADHTFEPSHTGQVCERLVFRDGGGDQCGLPPEAHPQHEPEPELPAVGDPETIRSEESGGNSINLLERVRAKAMEKGVDLSGVDFKPASAIEPPAEKEEAEPAVEPAPQRDSEPPAPAAIASSDACPNCGSELINGECWECM